MTTCVLLRIVLKDGSGMRYNGSLKCQTLTGNEQMNEYGEPVAAQVSWGDPVPCSIKTNSDTRKGKYEDGEFRMASFTILIEFVAGFAADRVKLERNGEELGEYRVLSVEPLTSVGRIQIMV